MANQQLASEAAAEALAAGIERDSPEFFQAVEQGFAKRLDALSQRAAEQLAPAFFAPRPAPSPAAPDRSAMYSAPVSRGTPSGGTGQRPPRQIRLTAPWCFRRRTQRAALAASSGTHTDGVSRGQDQ